MSGKRLTLHYHKGTHRNIPVRRAGFAVGARQYADFAVLWGLMPDQLVLPRLDSESVTTEQKGAVRRRQWGAERRSEPLSIVHPRPSRRKIILGRLGILTTLAAWITYVISTILKELADNPNAGFRFQFETVSYLIVVTFLTFSALMYLMARQGALYRFRDHARVPRGELDRHFAEYSEGITVLVPSYAEEPQVVRATLWSAALQEFPDLKVVLLLDDPPHPSDLGDRGPAGQDPRADRGDRRRAQRPGRPLQRCPGRFPPPG